MSTINKLAAEFIGTFCLVFVGCGAALFSLVHMQSTGTVNPPNADIGVGFVGVALAFGLTVMSMAYAVGHISGGHFNPAVSLGMWATGRFKLGDLLGYMVAQVVGAVAGAVVLYVIANGQHSFTVGGFASNGYGAAHSPGSFSATSCFLAEMIFTGIFIFIIAGSTSERAPKGMAPIAIGLGLTMIHLALIPITNCSLNPARSTATALIVAGFGKADSGHVWAMQQLWMFWLAPLLGGLLGGVAYRLVSAEGPAEGMESPKKVAAVVKKEDDSYDRNAPERFDVGGPSPKPKPAEKKV